MSNNLSAPKKVVLGMQHIFAASGATLLVPLLCGLSVPATLLFAGIATLFFHLVTKGKVPVFLGSSFAYIAGYTAINNAPYASVGVFVAGLLYLVLALLCYKFGADRVTKFFPVSITGPIIMAIGISLIPSAIDNCKTDWLIAVVALVITLAFSFSGIKFTKTCSIILAIMISMLCAWYFGKLDMSGVNAAAWIGLPIAGSNTVFGLFGSTIDWSLIGKSIIIMTPIALATMMEHIGDIAAVGSVTGNDYMKDPGLHRTLIGDGVGTSLAALFGAPANTTYSENTATLALTKVFDPVVMRIAAVFAIVLSFCPKFAALIHAIPAATVGGISLVLYAMIAFVGGKSLFQSKGTMKDFRNVVLVVIVFCVGLYNLALATIVGVILNCAFQKFREK